MARPRRSCSVSGRQPAESCADTRAPEATRADAARHASARAATSLRLRSISGESGATSPTRVLRERAGSLLRYFVTSLLGGDALIVGEIGRASCRERV